MLESHGASRILASFHDIVPNWIFAGLYFSDEYIEAHPDLVEKVLQGMIKSFAFIKENETEARTLLPKYTKVEEELCMIAALREYSPIEPIERIKVQEKLMVDYGYITSESTVESMLDYRFVPAELVELGHNPKEQKP